MKKKNLKGVIFVKIGLGFWSDKLVISLSKMILSNNGQILEGF